MIAIFFQSLIIGYSGAVMPGPLLTYTINNSISKGTKAGFLVSIGHALPELLLVIALFLGLGKLITIPMVQIVIGIVGGIVIFFFGAGMIKEIVSNKAGVQIEQDPSAKQGNMMLDAAAISVLNPYFLIWWASIGLGLMMTAYSAFGVIGVILFYISHILADFTWYVFVSLLIGKSRRFMNDKVYKIIKIVLAACLIGFGINFIVQACLKIFA